MKNSIEAKRLPWDTDYFEIESARVDLHGITSEDEQKKVIQFCQDYEFVTIANHDNLPENNRWIGVRTSAFLADMNIQFSKSITHPNEKTDKNTTVMSCLARNEQILQIAEKAYIYSRFYNDPKLPEKKARGIYRHWTEDAFLENDKHFVIHRKDNRVAGYVLFSIEESAATIELIAVDSNYKGQRVGTALIQKLENYLAERNINEICVGTQTDNVAAVSFYIKQGFRYVGNSSVYHCWKNHGEIVE